MREVVRTGQPIILDIMELRGQSVVVTRMPLSNEAGRVIGALGFVLYDRLDYLKPLVAKFAKLQSELADANRRLVENRRPHYTLSSFIGSSAPCVEVKRQARRAAMQNTTVLLLGETGTGKELLAQSRGRAHARAARQIDAGIAAVVLDEQRKVQAVRGSLDIGLAARQYMGRSGNALGPARALHRLARGFVELRSRAGEGDAVLLQGPYDFDARDVLVGRAVAEVEVEIESFVDPALDLRD